MTATLSTSTKRVPMIVIEGVDALDPVRVILEDIGPGKGRMIIVCFDAAWTGYWGAMGDRSIAQFVESCDEEYLAGNFLSASGLSRARQHRTYLIRILRAIRKVLPDYIAMYE